MSALLFTHSWRENNWIHTFPKGISAMWNAIRLVQDLNSWYVTEVGKIIIIHVALVAGFELSAKPVEIWAYIFVSNIFFSKMGSPSLSLFSFRFVHLNKAEEFNNKNT